MAPSEENPFAALTEYELRNLVAHLEAAGKAEQLHRVLGLPTDVGRNAWYEAQLALGDTAAYAADVARAWQAAEATAEIGLEVRYALVTSTLNSQAQNLPPELAVAALARELWSGRRTVAFVRQLQDAATRAAALAAIAPHVDAALQDEVSAELLGALAVAAGDGTLTADVFSALPELPGPAVAQIAALAGSLADPEARALALRAVAPRLPEPARGDALREALDAARDTPAGGGRVHAFSVLVPVLDEPLRTEAASEALAAARRRASADGAGTRLDALVRIAPFLSEQQIEAALGVARSLETWEERVRAASALTPRLPDSLLADAIERARKARSKQERVALLAELANRCSEPLSRELRDEALAAARATPIHLGRATALAGVAARLPEQDREPVVDEALAAVPRDSLETEPVLVQLAPYLSERQVEVALALARKLEAPGQRREVFSALWARLPAHLTRPVLLSRLAAARAEDYEPFRIEGLAELLPLLSPAARPRAAREALEAARSLESGEFRARYYALLAPHLPAELLRDAIEAAQTIDDRGPRSLLLLSLATHADVPLETEVVGDALAVARAHHDFADRAPILAELAPHLPAPLLEEALRAVTSTTLDDNPDDSATAKTLEALAPHLPEALLPTALNLALTLEYLEPRAAALAALGPYLSEELLEQAVAAAREIPPGGHSDGRHGGGRHHKADALAALAPHLPEPSGTRVLQEALETARETRWPVDRAETLADLLQFLPPDLHPEVVADALAAIGEADIPDPQAARVLSALAPYVPDSLEQEVLSAARDLREHVSRTHALLALARHAAHSSASALDGALASARSIESGSMDDEVAKVSLLVDLAELVPPAVRSEVLQEALAVVLATENPAYRFAAGAGRLVPLLAPTERQRVLDRALTQARSWPDSTTKAETLLSIGSVLPESAQVEMLREALALQRRESSSLETERFRVSLPQFNDLPHDALHAVWSPTLHDLVADSRPLFLRRVRELVPLIVAMGDAAAAAAARDAAVAVTTWWP